MGNRFAKVKTHWRAGLPDPGEWIAGSLVWGALMAASAWAGMEWHGWLLGSDRLKVILLFLAGGLLAFAPSLVLFALLDAIRPLRPAQRFAAMLLLLAIVTIAITALIFSQLFRHYFAQWDEPFPTYIWFLETVFTTLAAIYHFLVMGLRLFLPVGFPALFAAALWQARKSR